MPELKRLHAGDAPAVLAFELVNRAYFAAFVSDRGDQFFDQFADRYGALLAEQDKAGIGAFYVLVAEDGSVLGRFNLYDVEDGAAVLGYRVAQHVGRGVATAAVRELCRLAAARHGLRILRAATSRDNVASQRVLAKAGFAPRLARPTRPTSAVSLAAGISVT